MKKAKATMPTSWPDGPIELSPDMVENWREDAHYISPQAMEAAQQATRPEKRTPRPLLQERIARRRKNRSRP